MLLLISLVLAVLPLLGIAGMAMGGMLESVGGLFMSLILLTISGIFWLNVYWEARDRGYLAFLRRKKDGGAPPSLKAS